MKKIILVPCALRSMFWYHLYCAACSGRAAGPRDEPCRQFHRLWREMAVLNAAHQQVHRGDADLFIRLRHRRQAHAVRQGRNNVVKTRHRHVTRYGKAERFQMFRQARRCVVIEADSRRRSLLFRQAEDGIDKSPVPVVLVRREIDNHLRHLGIARAAHRVQVALDPILDGVDRLEAREVGDPPVSLRDQMRDNLKHRFLIFDPDEININAGHLPVEHDKRDAAADLTREIAVAAVRIGVEQRPAKALVPDVAQVRGLPRRVFFFRLDPAAEVQKHGMVPEFHQRQIHPPENPLLGCAGMLQRPAVPHDQSDQVGR